MDEVRFGTQPFSDWFAHATVIPATLFADFVNIDPKTATMEMRGSWRDYKFSTASPVNDRERDSVGESHKSLDNLYYIQLLSNELPSLHFWSYADPIGNSGQMRHGLISKGTSACYDIEGENMISNIHINFNRLQNLPLRNGDPFESEQITNGDPKHSPKNSLACSKSPRSGKDQTIYRTRSDEDLPRRPYGRRRRPRTMHDSSYKPRRVEGEDRQEVKLKKRKKEQAKEEKTYKPDLASRITRASSDEDEEEVKVKEQELESLNRPA
jgi:hypothetical protein